MACNCWTSGKNCCVKHADWNNCYGFGAEPPSKCIDPNHVPGVLHMVIPPAGYHHRCPSCGKVTILYGTNITV